MKISNSVYYNDQKKLLLSERLYISDATILIANLMLRSLHCICETVTKKRERNKLLPPSSAVLAFFRFSQCTFSNQECEEINHWDLLARALASQCSLFFDDELPRDFMT